MKVRFDDRYIELTGDYILALRLLMFVECEMMRETFPEDAALWYWGRCYVGDMASRKCMEFDYGERGSMPQDGLGQFGVIAREWE